MTRRPWTISRAEGIGSLAGLCALLLWPAFAAWAWIEPAFLLAIGLTAFCGLSVLAFSLLDLATRRRGATVLPVRSFDIALGILLATPSLMVLLEFI